MIRFVLFSFALVLSPTLFAAETPPLKALLIAGGCCHDYAAQHKILSQGIQARANVQVDVIWTEDKSTNPPLPLYDNPDWAKGYDIVIHDECAAGSKDLGTVKRILDVHKTVPSVHLHCAMHSFRTGTDAWFKHLGLQSSAHGPQQPIALTYVDKDHPVTQGLADWTTIKEELYNNVNVFDAHPLIMGRQVVKQKDGSSLEVDSIVAWTNEKQGARSFSTTIGHNNETVADARYLDLLTRGMLWAMDKLRPEYQTPFQGQNRVTFVKASAAPAAATAKPPAETPKPGLLADGSKVTLTASSEESRKGNFAWKALDHDEKTRWCASSPAYPQWLQLELEKPQPLAGITFSGENTGVCQYKIEASTDGKISQTLVDASSNKTKAPYSHDFAEVANVKFVKIVALGKVGGGWASVREVALKTESTQPQATKKPVSSAPAAVDKAAVDPFAKEGNIVPKIVKLSAEAEAEILKDVKVAEGFEATLFANSQAANYPVFVAAAPDGTLYVSSDGNGSLGRQPKRGRVIRLRDLDGDGRADETKVFCEVDAPRGLVWDHDRLFLVHPPYLSEMIDADGDGVAEEQEILVDGIAFDYTGRPADHTTNGLSLGIDGWLYIAGGDFGFMKATGKDGRTVQHRGGGVIRVRPDGTGLEIYSTGTRNILEVAISPLMDIFARDNTNDGGGWNVRFHHFTGLDDHGYPRLYKNFNDDAVQPLADYGGGSGCGAVYIDEPGFGKWNDAPFTADWGTGAIYKQSVRRKGATFEESAPPEAFIKMTRPTDADVDGMSRVYAASWKGATFNWAGPDVGYIVQVRPKGFKPAPLVDQATATDAALVNELSSDSNRRRMAAQRELQTRIPSLAEETQKQIDALLSNNQAPAAARVAAVYAFGITRDDTEPQVERAWFRCLMTNYQGSRFTVNDRPKFTSVDKDDEIEPIAVIDSLRLAMQLPKDAKEGNSIFSQAFISVDPVVQHCAIRALAMVEGWELAFDMVDTLRGLDNALRALSMMHKPEVVTGLIERLAKATDAALRQGILAALCRLHFHEGEWKGDSWGTRPDTRGPYYQPEAWSETPKIAATLKNALAKAGPEEAAFLVKEMNRNRIQSNDALQRILTLAKEDPKVIPDAVAQLAVAESIPADAVPMLVEVVSTAGTPARPNHPGGETAKADDAGKSARSTLLSQAIIALTKTDSAEGVSATLAILPELKKMEGGFKDYEAASTAFFEAPKLENHHQLIEDNAAKLDGQTSRYADAALLYLAARTTGSPESRELSQKALDHGWQDAKRRVQILEAIAAVKHQASAPKVLAALDDPDPKVKRTAESTAKTLKLTRAEDKTPKIATLTPEAAIAAVLKTQGDLALGEQVFTRATCIACHTTKESEAQKGPYLGNIAQTYKRPDLAQNILDPNKTIAQGFASELITMKDGAQQMGFITLEGADEVKLRNIAAQEFTFKTTDIKERQKLPMSMMPPGLMMNFTVREFASLLDYLESLAKK